MLVLVYIGGVVVVAVGLSSLVVVFLAPCVQRGFAVAFLFSADHDGNSRMYEMLVGFRERRRR